MRLRADGDHCGDRPSSAWDTAAPGCRGCRWEHANVLSLPQTRDGVDCVLDALEMDDIAAEVVWSGPPIVFVGSRIGHLRRSPLHEIATRSDWTPSRSLDILAGVSLGPQAELGAFNAWQSVGPLPLAVDADAAAVGIALALRTDLTSCHRPVALEIVFHQPHEAWWGIGISSRLGDTHIVRVEAVMRVLRSISGGFS